MSTREKIWSAVLVLSIVVISISVIASSLRNQVFVDNSSADSNQLNTPSSTKAVDKNQRFLSTLESSVSSETRRLIKQIPDSQKIIAGEKICQAFAQDITFNDLKAAFIQKYGTNSATTEYAGALIGASVGAYCPEHADKLPVH